MLKDHTALATEFRRFIDQITCNSDNKKCMSCECDECKSLFDAFVPQSPSDTLKYQQWQKTSDRIEKVELVATVGDAFSELKSQLRHFLIHTYVKRRQAAHFSNSILQSSEKSLVLQVDFSENATIGSQNEIQSGHWNHSQATLFTAHAWAGDGKNESFVLISDLLTHNKESVYAFMTYIFRFLRENFELLEEINIFSDGAGSQFKQKYLFSNLHAWEHEYDLVLKWNFFATSHGKGAVDGLGGTVKRTVWRQVRIGNVHVNTPEEYAKVAVSCNPNIHINFISKTDIQANEQYLSAKWHDIPRTHQLHCFIPSGKYRMKVAETSDSKEFTLQYIRNNTEEEMLEENVTENTSDSECESMDEMVDESEEIEALSIGQWVLVNYDGKQYPGEITKIKNSLTDIEINVMHQSGSKFWKWPTSQDKIYYQRKSITRIIEAPKVAGSRGQFTFEHL